MSNVASLELCKELYELSGWQVADWWRDIQDDRGHHWKDITNGEFQGTLDEGEKLTTAPAYSLGYLLRKLPRTIDSDKDSYFNADLFLEPGVAGTWNAGYRIGAATPMICSREDTPEDATCKLAIELFKQGILEQGKL